MNSRWRQLLLYAGCFALSCSGSADRPPSANINIEGGSSPTGRSPGFAEYPSGPYGISNPDVGELIQDLSLLGYTGHGEPIRPSADLEELSFSKIRSGPARYLLVHVSSLWCGTCVAEAFYMNEYTRQILEAGGAVLEILIDGNTLGLEPTQEELDVWVRNNDLRMTTVIPGDEHVRRVFPDRDYVYIIDLRTMEVVWQEAGPGDDQATTEIGALEMVVHYLSE